MKIFYFITILLFISVILILITHFDRYVFKPFIIGKHEEKSRTLDRKGSYEMTSLGGPGLSNMKTQF